MVRWKSMAASPGQRCSAFMIVMRVDGMDLRLEGCEDPLKHEGLSY